VGARRGNGVRTAALGLALAVLVTAAPARADFGSVRKVWNGSAYTLERGEFAVGIFSPIQYGLLDDLTVATHPVLDLLAVPNVALKWKPVDVGVAAVSFTATYLQAFLETSSRINIPGAVAVFPTVTFPFGHQVSLSVHGGYALDILPGEPVRVDHGVTYGMSLSVLITPADLLSIVVTDQWYAGTGLALPTAIVSYTHAFYQTHLTVGIAGGKFPIQIGDTGARFFQMPVYPVIDVWWVL
jgi:hypothetical protein